MRVRVITKDTRLFIPVPVHMIGFVLRWIPDGVFEKIRQNTPEPYSALMTKETVCMVMMECQGILKENKGLEIVHVEGEDGTFVSIQL